MPFSNESDAIVKRLHPFFSEVVGGKQLHRLGWYDYLKFDHLESADAVEIAADALLYLSKDTFDGWNDLPKLLQAVFAFLREETGKQPSAVQARALGSLLKTRPLDDEQITAWFKQTF